MRFFKCFQDPERYNSIAQSNTKRRLGANCVVRLIAHGVLGSSIPDESVEVFDSYISIQSRSQDYRYHIHFPANNTSETDLRLNSADSRGLRQLMPALTKSNTVIHLIPIEQHWRAHWTLLMIQGTEATLVDPKDIPVLPWYDERCVRKIVQEYGYTLNILRVGVQQPENDTLCGYVVAQLVLDILEQDTIPDVAQQDPRPEMRRRAINLTIERSSSSILHATENALTEESQGNASVLRTKVEEAKQKYTTDYTGDDSDDEGSLLCRTSGEGSGGEAKYGF